MLAAFAAETNPVTCIWESGLRRLPLRSLAIPTSPWTPETMVRPLKLGIRDRPRILDNHVDVGGCKKADYRARRATHSRADQRRQPNEEGRIILTGLHPRGLVTYTQGVVELPVHRIPRVGTIDRIFELIGDLSLVGYRYRCS